MPASLPIAPLPPRPREPLALNPGPRRLGDHSHLQRSFD